MAQDQGLDEQEGPGLGQDASASSSSSSPSRIQRMSSSSLPPVNQSILPPVIEINDDGSIVASPLPTHPIAPTPISPIGQDTLTNHHEMNATHRDHGSNRQTTGAPSLPPIKPSDEPAIERIGLGLSPAAAGQGLGSNSGSHNSHRSIDKSPDKGSEKGSGAKKKGPSQAANRARLVSDVVAKAQGPVAKDPSYALQVPDTPLTHTMSS